MKAKEGRFWSKEKHKLRREAENVYQIRKSAISIVLQSHRYGERESDSIKLKSEELNVIIGLIGYYEKCYFSGL